MAHLVMFLYTAFYIGRIHELVAFLRPLRIVLLLGLLGIVLTLTLPRGKRNRVLRQPEVRVVVGLVAVAVLFAPFSLWPGGSASFLIDNFSRVVVFFFLIVALATSRQVIEHLVWSVLTGVALLGIFTIFWGASLSTDYGGRAYASSTYDPNDVAMVMVCTLPLAAFAAIALRGVRRLLAIGAAIVCVLTILMTMSRGGFIGLVIVSVLLLFRLGKASLAPRVLILITVATFLAGAAPAKYWQVMATIWRPTSGGAYVESGLLPRVELWKRGVGFFLAAPLTGGGVGAFEVAEGRSHGGAGAWMTAHNSFVQLGAELGVFGFTLFLTLIALGIRDARRVVRAAKRDVRLRPLTWVARAVEMSLYAYVVEGFALSQAYSPMLYFLIALAVALRLQVERAAPAPARVVAAPVALRPRTATK